MLLILSCLSVYIFFYNFGTGHSKNMDNMCTVFLDVSPNSPLLIKTDEQRVWYPSRGHYPYMQFPQGKRVHFGCPGSTVTVGGIDTGKTIIQGTCQPKMKENYRWSEITCKSYKTTTLRQRNIKCAHYNGDYYSVAFEFSKYLRVEVFAVCFGAQIYMPFYTYHHLIPIFRTMITEEPNIVFKDENFYFGYDVSLLYKQDLQKQKINKLLNLHPDSNKYIAKNQYLEMKYLVPSFDFYYAAFRNNSYRYINAVHQWSSVKHGNWNDLERRVRTFSRIMQFALQIWTGVYGILSLPDEKGESQNVYLDMDDDVNLPVPALFWKVLYQRRNKLAIVLITINNPFTQNVSDYLICEDISQYNQWLNWETISDPYYGYTYSCTVDSFRKTVDYFAAIGVQGVLDWDPSQN